LFLLQLNLCHQTFRTQKKRGTFSLHLIIRGIWTTYQVKLTNKAHAKMRERCRLRSWLDIFQKCPVFE